MLGKCCHPPSPAFSLFQHQGSAEDEVVGWHHQLNGHESEQILGDSEGQDRSQRVRHDLVTE